MSKLDTARLSELADMLERDACETLHSDACHFWYEGKKNADPKRIDYALEQLGRASRLRALAKEQK